MKKTNLFLLSLIALSLLALTTLTGCGGLGYTVKYEITGPATVANRITYINDTGGHETLSDVNIPWSKTINVRDKQYTNAFASVSCSAIINNNGNTYTAKIYVNGQQKISSSSSLGSVFVVYTIP